MDYIQQQINEHKNKLKILINNLINTQNIYEEINFNNEIKKESDFIFSLLNIKQNKLNNQINQMYQDFNMNLNPFDFNVNMMAMNQPNISRNIINIFFNQMWTNEIYTIECSPDEKIEILIQKYRIKSGDYDIRREFLFNAKKLVPNKSASEEGLTHFSKVTILKSQDLKNINIIKLLFSTLV